MRYANLVLILGLGALGCSAGPQVFVANPIQVPAQSYDAVWEQTVDVVDDYFEIAEENRIDGRIETVAKLGATLLEPWHRDAVNFDERLEATLQTIRRRAVVRITPDADGYLVEAEVIKELEDLPRPEHATAGDAIFRHDEPVKSRAELITDQPPTQGWIIVGRDFALEHELLRRLEQRLLRE